MVIINIKLTKRQCQQLCNAMNYRIVEGFHSNVTFPIHSHFPSSLSRQAGIVGKSHSFPSLPDVYPSISIALGWQTHTLTHTHYNIYCISSKFLYSLPAWLQPHCLCYAMCFCQRSPAVGRPGRSHGGDSLRSVTATSAAAHTSNTHTHPLTCMRTGTRGWLVGGIN